LIFLFVGFHNPFVPQYSSRSDIRCPKKGLADKFIQTYAPPKPFIAAGATRTSPKKALPKTTSNGRNQKPTAQSSACHGNRPPAPSSERQFSVRWLNAYLDRNVLTVLKSTVF
jgi:hypothetical protein